MGLSSFFRKKPQQADDTEGAFASRAETESNAARGRIRRKSGKQPLEPVDPVLPEKKRARRRLVGAVALVLAAIIGLPMILDSEPKPLSDDLIVQIPSKEQSGPTPVIRAPASGNAPPSSMPAGAALDQREELIVPAAPLSEIAPALAKPNLNAPLAQDKPQSDVEQEVNLKPHFDRKHELKSAPTAAIAEASDDAVRARAILDGAVEPARAAKADKPDISDKADKKPARLMVQIAALASKEKVAELQGKLKAAGIVSHTQTIATNNGERIRVRIGPFGSREEADKARSRLSGIGLTGTVVPG